MKPMAKLKLKPSKRQHARNGSVSCPIFLHLFRPTLAEIPVGAAVRPGLLVLEIFTPPVFGECANERRYLRFPVYLRPGTDPASPRAAIAAFHALTQSDEMIRDKVEELKELARSPTSRAWAHANHDYAFDDAATVVQRAEAAEISARGNSNFANSK